MSWNATDVISENEVHAMLIKLLEKKDTALRKGDRALADKIKDEMYYHVIHFSGYTAAKHVNLQSMPPFDMLLTVPSQIIIEHYFRDEN